MARQTRRAAPAVADLDRLNVAADALAEFLDVEPEMIATEPSSLRLSLTLSQAETLVASLRRIGDATLSIADALLDRERA